MDQLLRFKNRAQKLQVLHDIGKAILSSSFDLDKLFIEVVDAGIYLLKTEECRLILNDDQTRELYEVAYKNSSDNSVQLSRIRVRDNILETIITKGKPIRINKTKFDTGLIVKSLLGVPLVIRGDALGALLTYNIKQETSFSEEDEYFLTILANYAAIAYENYKLNDKARMLASLSSLSQNLLTTYDLNRDLEYIVDEALRVLNADVVTLYEYILETDDFKMPPIVRGTVNQNEVLQIKGRLHRDAIVFKLIKNSQPFFAHDARTDWINAGFYKVGSPGIKSNFVAREEIISSVGVPLIVNGSMPVGVLFVNYRKSHSFAPDFQEKLTLFANYAALVIHNKRIYSQSIEYGEKLVALNKIGQVIGESETLNLDEILRTIHSETGRLMDVSNFYVALYDDISGFIHFRFATEDGVIQEVGRGEWVSRKKGNGLTEYLIKTGRSLLLENNSETWMRSHNINLIGRLAKSWLGSPMISRGKVIGVIAVQDYVSENTYTQKHKEIFETLAVNAAVAIDNSLLLHKASNYAIELDKLTSLSRGILEGEEIEDILTEAVRASCELTGGDISTILLYRFPDKENIYIESCWPKSDTYIDTLRLVGRAIPVNSGVTGLVAKSQKPQIVPDVRAFPKYINLIPSTQSEIAVPILKRNEKEQSEVLVGVLNVESRELDHFTLMHQDLLLKLGMQVAIALEQKRHIQELDRIRRHYKEASDLANIGFVYGEDLHIANNRLGAARQYAIDITEIQDLHLIRDYAKRIRLNIDEFLDLLDELRREINPPDPVDYDIHELLRATVDSVKKSSLISTDYKLGNFIPIVNGYKSQIGHVFRVVIYNAIEAMNGEGSLTISTEQIMRDNLAFIEVRIADTGPGIPDYIKQDIFSLKKSPRKKRGFGLGLPWSSLVLRITGGDMFPETESGKGTTMVILIPKDCRVFLNESGG